MWDAEKAGMQMQGAGRPLQPRLKAKTKPKAKTRAVVFSRLRRLRSF